ncbi:two-component regulator propeller domain-containing protein [Fulvivirgaceae bacterium BMA10]|uniref:Two-component regulator propeller domain-containing protein n=1 Tax=Splendidivirga corallicola TaxID=3051826 RepID=A0ABT8KNA7_9BACT|nr:two-component regulator propeller domain-containing protein [Fulvivirgaceae bacterium BMA10]
MLWLKIRNVNENYLNGRLKPETFLTKAGRKTLLSNILKIISICTFFFLNVIPGALCNGSLSDIEFYHLSAKDGLRHNRVTSVVQDYRGFMWFGTDDGVNRYDGYEFKVYDLGHRQNHILTDLQLLEDRQKRLWVASSAGLSLYNRDQDQFESYFNSADEHFKSGIRKIYEDKAGNIWLSFNRGGLGKIDPNKHFTLIKMGELFTANEESLIITAFYEDQNRNFLLGTNLGQLLLFNETLKSKPHSPIFSLRKNTGDVAPITSICQDNSDNIWVGTLGNGLFKIPELTENSVHYKVEEQFKSGLQSNIILCIYLDSQHNIWIGTDGGGLSLYNPEQDGFFTFKKNNSNPNSISAQVINDLTEDRLGNLWLATSHKGISYFRIKRSFDFFHKSYFNRLPSTIVNAILEDTQGNIWIGTDGGGLLRYNSNLESFKQYKFDKNVSIPSNKVVVNALCEDIAGKLWIGTYGYGLFVFDQQNKLLHKVDFENKLIFNDVYAIIEDHQKWLWIGTNDGLIRYDPLNKDFISFTHKNADLNSLSNNSVRSLFQDIKGNIWVGTLHGLNQYNIENDYFQRIYSVDGVSESISGNTVVSIFEDSNLNLWFGTYGCGLNKYNRSKNTFQRIDEKDGLSNNYVHGILEDHDKHLWISTNKGLSKINLSSLNITNYGYEKGIQQFCRGASYKTKEGRMYFGGLNGLISFLPEKIDLQNYEIPIVFTDFKVLNENTPIDQSNSPLDRSITETNSITLNHSQSFFTIKFALLDYTPSNKKKYAYKLKGYNNAWNEISDQRIINYTSLPSGDYELLVKGSNGYWDSKEISLKIHVLPPFWEKIWFRIAIGAFFVLTFIGFYKLRVRGIRNQKEKLKRLVISKTEKLKLQQKEIIRKKQQLLVAEKENLTLQKKRLKDELDFKIKELTNHSIRSIHKNKLLKKLRVELKRISFKLDTNSKLHIRKMMEQIDDSLILDEDWEDFFAIFNEVHGSFLECLVGRYPNLTKGEKRLCALLKLNFSTQDIATLLGISFTSVKVARHRLRKKFNIHSKESLVDFLMEMELEAERSLDEVSKV